MLLAEAGVRVGASSEAMVGMAVAAGAMIWGFGLWWGIVASLVMFRGYQRLPFAISWWGFTFPLGAWVVAGLALAVASGSLLLGVISGAGGIVLTVVWVLVFVRTLLGVIRGSIWE